MKTKTRTALFQSLVCWIGVVKNNGGYHDKHTEEFQSLVCWIGVVKFNLFGLTLKKDSVSILGMLDRCCKGAYGS